MIPGENLAHYRIGEQLGVGGMGEVWAAVDTRLGRNVALKFLPEAFIADPGRHARFHAEAQALAAFSHPHVAGIYSLEEADGQHFLAMELVPGDDLSDRLKAGALGEKTALTIARQIALALAAAHAKGIIHRDLKPANIKVTTDDQVKVLDFGLAKIYQPEAGGTAAVGSLPTVTSEMTAAGAILGTAAYMSPEQARAKPVDKRADIWAFGCVLFEMLTGKLAFSGETVSDTLAALLRAEPDWQALPAAASPGVRRLLRRCLQKDPDQRLHDIADARLEIDAVLGGTDAADTVPGIATGRGGRRGARLAAVVGWVAAVAVATFWLLSPEPPAPSPARITNLTLSGRDWAPAGAPDGRTVVFTSDRDSRSRIWLKQMATGNETPLTEGPDDRARFSPDGSQILFVRDDGAVRSLYRMAIVGGQPRKLMDDVIEAAWSPDGRQVAFVRITPVGENNIVSIGIADVQTGAERILAGIENRLIYALYWRPDGKSLSFAETSLTGNRMIANSFNLLDVASGEISVQETQGWGGPLTGPQWSPDGQSVVLGASQDLLAFSSGAPTTVAQVWFDGRPPREILSGTMRTPRGGWGYTAVVALNDHELVYDHHDQYSELHLVPLADGRPAGPIEVLTSSLGRDRQPVFSADRRHVLFSSNRAGNIDLWQVDTATGDLRQVTDDPAHDWDPAYSPDGRSILWSSDRTGHMEIWLANADGSGARMVSSDGEDAENPTVTPDNSWIVYASGSSSKMGIWRIRPDGTEAANIAPGANLLAEVSPDGRYALYSVVRSLDFVIKVVEIETGADVDFEIVIPVSKRDRDVVFGRARWSADGTGIVYVGQDSTGRSGIYLQDFTPGRDPQAPPVPLAGFSSRFDTESLGVSRDGSLLVYSAMHNRRVLKHVQNVKLLDW